MADNLISSTNADNVQTLERNNGTRTGRNLVSLNSLLNPRTTKLINNKVFKGNESEFRQFIQHLESHHTWQDSLKLIEAELAKRKIKPNDQGAVMLSNVVYRRYYPHDDGVKID